MATSTPGAGSGPTAPRPKRAARPRTRTTRTAASAPPADSASDGPAPAPVRPAGSPRTLLTLAIDVGGTGIKASVLDEAGQMEQDRVRIPTPYPLSPQKLVTVIVDLVKPLPMFDRV